MPFHVVSFFAEVKFFIFWPKTMDYNKAFLPKSRRFSAFLLLHSGRCYEAEICAILFLLRCPFMWYHFLPKSKFSDFWPKTMDYSKAFLPKSFVVLLLHNGRCYEAEIWTILLLLICAFAWNHPKKLATIVTHKYCQIHCSDDLYHACTLDTVSVPITPHWKVLRS